ncbi:hypothetical protein K443DRAFT_681712 [Laccaria amethystina LaAM-08-1]|uniref:Actin patches distal protein 1 n=1 Tax=Laccaria amethystina LaAM-08-1 TaxID=1095629 RepID=A0A0C9XHU6_9AGAR|nr:hypothetical protein K443DRAFT_681712 [Laccaria amethystina LaAM-08-1]
MGTTAPAVSSEQDLSTEEKPLYGTVASHRSYIFLHSPIPPTKFSSRMTTPLQRALQLRASKWGGIVNFSWFEGGDRNADVSQEATAFSALGGRLELENLVLEDVDSVDAVLREHAAGLHPSRPHENTEIHLYVCTHGERDCRCGDMGGKVVSALKKEVKERGDSADRVRIGEVGHVGGHQYAANVLVFPQGEWLGRVTPETVPDLLTAVLASPRRPFTPSEPPLLRDHWRGRTGLGEEEQVAFFESSR